MGSSLAKTLNKVTRYSAHHSDRIILKVSGQSPVARAPIDVSYASIRVVNTVGQAARERERAYKLNESEASVERARSKLPS